MGIIISVINNKGGCGKTTTAVNLAVALGRKGEKVLVVDCDSQANASKLLKNGMVRTFQHTLFNFMDPDNKPPTITDCIYATVYKNVLLLPNEPRSAIHGSRMVILGSDTLVLLRNRLRDYALSHFNFTIIDCPPNLETFVMNALIGSDFVIVPTDAGSSFSMEGLTTAKAFIDDIQKDANQDLRFLKLLITKVDSRTSICKAIIAGIKETFPENEVFNTTIPDNTDFQKAELMNQPIFKYRVSAPGAIAYTAVADELIAAIAKETKTKN